MAMSATSRERPGISGVLEEKARAPWGLVVVVLVAGYLLFAHGCHGDEDNELLARRNPSLIDINAAPPSAWVAEEVGPLAAIAGFPGNCSSARCHI